MKTKEKTALREISEKYCKVQHNEENYDLGGGLADDGKFKSRRHQDADEDEGKLTFGKATQLFKKATGEETDFVKSVIKYAVPNMEWHHAGVLPKQYGRGMKKTYFLNSFEICDIAKNWKSYVEKLEISKAKEKEDEATKKDFETRRMEYLEANAKKVERSLDMPEWFFQTKSEMKGKYGWFDSAGKSYNLPKYFSGWDLKNEKKYHEFWSIKK